MVSGDRDSVRRRPESTVVAVLLSLAGGALDGIVFTEHGVFANAQTGNLVLLGIGVARADWRALSSLVPVLAFVLGTAAAQGVARARAVLRRPTRVVLTVEIVVVAVVATVPAVAPSWVTVLPVSFVAALQAATFRSLRGQVYSTTMLTGNLRSAVLGVVRGIADRDRAALRGAVPIVLVLVAFCAGAGAGALLVDRIGPPALLAAAAALLAALAVIVAETRRLEAGPVSR